MFSPERVYSGRVFADLDTYPKLVGGLTPAGEARGVELYRAFITPEVWAMETRRSASTAPVSPGRPWSSLVTAISIGLIGFGLAFRRAWDAMGTDVDVRWTITKFGQAFQHCTMKLGRKTFRGDESVIRDQRQLQIQPEI